LPDLTFLSAYSKESGGRRDGTYFFAVDDCWDLEWEGSFHLLDGSLETFTVG
jgi:hypothetical protein